MNPSMTVPLRPYKAVQPRVMLAIGLATCIPVLMAFNMPPSATLLNQALAMTGWGAVVLVAASSRQMLPMDRGVGATLSALLLLIVAALSTPFLTGQPLGFGMATAGTLLVAAIVLFAGASMAADGRRNQTFRALCWAFLLAGTSSAVIGILQVFAPQWCDSNIVACTASAGRASGNLRQPNHLSSLLLWALIAIVALQDMKVVGRLVGGCWAAFLVFGVVLTGSRTGIVGVALLALWGVLDRRLAASTRQTLAATPVAYAALWYVTALWSEAGHGGFAGEARLSTASDISSSRFAIWSDTLELIGRHPWTGVGFGEFNFAWTLLPSPDRPVAFFDHTHNLPLNLAVELGLPAATLILILLSYALWSAFAAPMALREDEDRTPVRSLFMIVLMMVLHSQLEYPLWYSYFLLPTAFALGLCFGGGGPQVKGHPACLRLAACAVIAGGIATVWDYGRVVTIFAPPENAGPLEQRIETGKKSWFFSHHAHYAAATSTPDPSGAMGSFDVATHYLLDTRLMMAWANALAANGELDKAKHLAQRLREFRNADSEEFFAPCAQNIGATQSQPFQCSAPERVMDHRDFRPKR